MSPTYRDAVTPSGAFDRAALMRLAIGKARIEHARGATWPAALAYGLDLIWQSARAQRSSLRHQAALAKLPALDLEAVRCEAAALIAETAIPPRYAEAAAHRQRAAELRATRGGSEAA